MKFTVKGTTIRYNGKDYRPGSVINMTEDTAKDNERYLDPLPPEPASEEKKKAEAQEGIPEDNDTLPPESKGGKKKKGDEK
ncbi:MAG: hypothetical protein GX556_16520 [Fibrobacter sp.]|nr:hypothetical protein [Fibrobacter sp.]